MGQAQTDDPPAWVTGSDQADAEAADPLSEHPELIVAAALAGGFLLAKLTKKVLGDGRG